MKDILKTIGVAIILALFAYGLIILAELCL